MLKPLKLEVVKESDSELLQRCDPSMLEEELAWVGLGISRYASHVPNMFLVNTLTGIRFGMI